MNGRYADEKGQPLSFIDRFSFMEAMPCLAYRDYSFSFLCWRILPPVMNVLQKQMFICLVPFLSLHCPQHTHCSPSSAHRLVEALFSYQGLHPLHTHFFSQQCPHNSKHSLRPCVVHFFSSFAIFATLSTLYAVASLAALLQVSALHSLQFPLLLPLFISEKHGLLSAAYCIYKMKAVVWSLSCPMEFTLHNNAKNTL